MRLLALIPLTLALVIAGCGGNSSTVSFTPSPSNPNPGGGDTGGNPGGGNNPGNPGGNNPGDGDGPAGCGYKEFPTTLAHPDVLGNTAQPETYDLENYVQAPITSNLNGTWILVHTSTRERISNSNKVIEKEYVKSTFTIRNHSGSNFEISSCDTGAFVNIELPDSDVVSLPIYPLNSGASEYPRFSITNNSELIGEVSTDFSEHVTRSIKINDARLAQASASFSGTTNRDPAVTESSSIVNANCIIQWYLIESRQSCNASAQALTYMPIIRVAGENKANGIGAVKEASGINYLVMGDIFGVTQNNYIAPANTNDSPFNISISLSGYEAGSNSITATGTSILTIPTD